MKQKITTLESQRQVVFDALKTPTQHSAALESKKQILLAALKDKNRQLIASENENQVLAADWEAALDREIRIDFCPCYSGSLPCSFASHILS